MINAFFIDAIATLSQVMDHVAAACGLDPYDVRRKNAYHVDDKTILGQQLHYCKVDETLDEVEKMSDLSQRKDEVDMLTRIIFPDTIDIF